MMAADANLFDVWKAIRFPSENAIPAAKALICWKHEPGLGVIDVLVTEFQNYQAFPDNYWDLTAGACNAGWLVPVNRSMTPEAVFAEMVAGYGFAGRAVAEKAFVMFARIRECEWARMMVAPDSYDTLAKAELTTRW
ncbi:MAG TPA: hypothetical protein VGH36_14665 [Acetobacteraceae bacterium]